jgi:U3 small nucleolar RNA-associated protein 20
MAAAAPAAGKALTVLLKKAPDANHPVAQDCFRLLAGLLRECPAYQPSTAQLRFLLRWVATDLDGAPAENGAAFGLLRAVLGRKLMVPEVYDAMDKVQEVMIK